MKVAAVTIGVALAIGGGGEQALAFRGAHVPPNVPLVELPLIPCDDIPPPLAAACLPNLLSLYRETRHPHYITKEPDPIKDRAPPYAGSGVEGERPRATR
jgi:hypothetical protein